MARCESLLWYACVVRTAFDLPLHNQGPQVQFPSRNRVWVNWSTCRTVPNPFINRELPSSLWKLQGANTEKNYPRLVRRWVISAKRWGLTTIRNTLYLLKYLNIFLEEEVVSYTTLPPLRTSMLTYILYTYNRKGRKGALFLATRRKFLFYHTQISSNPSRI